MPKRNLSRVEPSDPNPKKARLSPPPQLEDKHRILDAQPPRLLNLPGETLNTIYQYALTADDGRLKVVIPRSNPREPTEKILPMDGGRSHIDRFLETGFTEGCFWPP